jgi:hypothetical protein
MISSSDNNNTNIFKDKDISSSHSQSLRSSYSCLHERSNKLFKKVHLINLKNRISSSLSRYTIAPRSFKKINTKQFINDEELKILSKNNSNINNPQSSSVSISSSAPNSSNHSKNLYKIININNNNLGSVRNPDCKINSRKMVSYLDKFITNHDHLNRLNKCLNNYRKSVSYFEQIIKNKKLEIISSSVTVILESIIELYYIMQNFNFEKLKLNQKNSNFNDEHNRKEENYKAAISMYRSNINESLANLLKWSDNFFYSGNGEINIDFNDVDVLIRNLDNCIKHFVNHYKNYYFGLSRIKKQRIQKNAYYVSKSLSPCPYRLSISRLPSLSVSSDNLSKVNNSSVILSSKNLGKQKLIKETDYDLLESKCHSAYKTEDIYKGIETINTTVNKSGYKSPSTFVTQTTTLSKSSNKKKSDKNSNSSINDIILYTSSELENSSSQLNDAFQQASILNNLDKLALELSELSSSNSSFNINKKYFDDELCVKLIPQFEKIIKEFSKKEKSNKPEFSISSNKNKTIFFK